MKEDFTTVKELYVNKVNLQATDFVQIKRIGKKKDNKGNSIRPIRLAFASAEKRLQILRNNKNLLLEDKSAKCDYQFCSEADKKHKHIHISPFKTDQERDQEKKLRDELKAKRIADPNSDYIIRYGKITKKTTSARWSEIQNGL